MLPIGTKVYYTGDMANQDGHFAVIAHRGGISCDLREDNGERTFRGVMHIAEQYNGSCGDRFVTESTWAAHREARILEMQRAAQRRNYLAKESA
jgi:hypothetical protein